MTKMMIADSLFEILRPSSVLAPMNSKQFRRRFQIPSRLKLTLLTSAGCILALPGTSTSQQTGDIDVTVDSTSAQQVTDAIIDPDDVLDWIDDLDAPSLAQRKAAETSLIEAGPAILSQLPSTDAELSIEAHDRLQRIRAALGKQLGQDESQTNATSIRLSGVQTLGEALEAISRDSGIEFETSADKNAPVQGTDAPLPFWHAIDLVLDQADLDINLYGGNRSTLNLVQRADERPSRVDSAAYTGVYRIEPTTVTSTRSLQHPELNGLNVTMDVAWQPSMTPIGLSIPVAELSGTLDDGGKVRPQVTAQTIDVATTADLTAADFYIPLDLPTGRPYRIASLRGVIEALLPGPAKTFEIPMTESERTATQDAMTITVEQVRPNGPLHEVRVGITLQDAGRALESHRQWIFENEAYVRNAAGRRLDHLGYEVYRQTDQGVGISYLFDLGDDLTGSKLIYSSPTTVTPNTVQFVVDDILLP